MEMKGANPPGILVLTTGLSKPFMRLDKYPTLLKELERHMEVKNVMMKKMGKGRREGAKRLCGVIGSLNITENDKQWMHS